MSKRPAILPTLPPNHCSHVVRYFDHLSKTTTEKPLHPYAIAPSILLSYRASAYANTMVMPSRFNVI